VPRLCEFYPGICLATEEKALKNLSEGRKNISQVKKNLSQYSINITKNTHTLQSPHKYTHITKPTSPTPSLTSALDGVGDQRHAWTALPPAKTRYRLNGRVGGPQGRSGRVRKIAPSPEFDPRTV
jgi:hypothetical protein